MRPRLNEFLLDTFHTDWVLYLIPSGITLYFIAIGLCLWLFLRRCQQSELNVPQAGIAALLAVMGGLVGARVYYLLHHYDYVLQNKEPIFKCGAGIASWGAYIGGLLVFIGYLLIRKLEVMKHLDVLASVLGLGPFLVRWACFMNGCCYGTSTNLPWAVRYPANSFAYHSNLEAGLITSSDSLSLPVHPVQIYLSILGLLLFIVTTFFWKKYRASPGITFFFYWLVYGLSRFFFEFLRGDVPRYSSVELTLSQIVILIMVGLSGIGIAILSRKRTSFNLRNS